MIDLSAGIAPGVSTPPLAPIGGPIDLAHLSRMTLGDPQLEADVLQLFDRQATMLLTRMVTGPAPIIAASAHTLKGSALGIGAWTVARNAEAVEAQASTGVSADLDRALERLSGSVAEARAVITDFLRAH